MPKETIDLEGVRVLFPTLTKSEIVYLVAKQNGLKYGMSRSTQWRVRKSLLEKGIVAKEGVK